MERYREKELRQVAFDEFGHSLVHTRKIIDSYNKGVNLFFLFVGMIILLKFNRKRNISIWNQKIWTRCDVRMMRK